MQHSVEAPAELLEVVRAARALLNNLDTTARDYPILSRSFESMGIESLRNALEKLDELP